MPRIARMVVEGEQAVYHVMSRTALDGFPFKGVEKDYFFKVVKRLSKVYFAEIMGLCCMDNHFHLLVKMLPEADFQDKHIRQKFALYYGKDRILEDGQIPYYRARWSSLSEFVKEIKLGFTRFYNRRHNRRGFLWGDRFKSVLVEKGETLINCLAYIDLNPVRAGIVEKPEEYRWNSIGYHVQTNNKDNLLSLDFGLKEFNVLDSKERLRRYRRFLYEKGVKATEKGIKLDERFVEKERARNFELSKTNRFAYRTRYFSDSGIIGTKAFVSKNYHQFKHFFHSKNEKIPKRISGLDGVYSLKRLTE
jgi:putative transposase